MNVKIEGSGVNMEVRNRVVVLDVKDANGNKRGDLHISKARLEWFPLTPAGRRCRKVWSQVIEYFEGG